MALFDKLFSLKRRLDSEYCYPKDRVRSRHINPEQVRLLLFKECDWRGRRLLFDSAAIERVPAGKHDKPSVKPDTVPCIVEVSDGFSYVYKGPEADATVLGEMIFGAVAMNYKNVSLKIHIMDEPRRLMCTKVFCVPASRRISRAERKTSDRIETSCSMRNVSMLRNVSTPLNVPSLREDGVALSFSMDRGDSGFCGDQSSYSSVGSMNDYFTLFDDWDGTASQEDFYSFHSLPGRKISISSNGSWQRRTFQNIATRFDLGQSSHRLNVPTAATSSDSQIYSSSSTSGTSDSIASGSTLPQRKSKLGLAVLITVSDADQLELVRKCVEQSPQLQALVCRLRVAAVRAGAGSSAAFVSTLHRAAASAAQWLSDLVYGPRLQARWLGLATADARCSNKLADLLLADLCAVLAVADTKTTNFFISTLLTHVLTYHLGWVTTVTPYDAPVPTPSPAQSVIRPYNALWAQLSDLCGSIGFPPRAARTIISGEKNTPFVNRLLSILTYFLRCGDVKRTKFRYRECPLKVSKTISVNRQPLGMKRNATRVDKLDCDGLKVSDTPTSDSSTSTLVASNASLKKTATLADLSQKLSTSPECSGSNGLKPSCPLRRNPTMMLSSLKTSSNSSLNSVSEDSMPEQKVVFVLGDDEKLVGLKNKSTNGKSVKKSSKVHNEPVVLELDRQECDRKGCEVRNRESPSKCCGQTLQHSKPIKHSGFKFEFDKYPQIVTNYMKSKNLEILDRHYIGKPGNLKLDNFQFDPMVVPPIQEEKCDACAKCQMMESLLQTPTNASEMEYMNDMPRISEPQYAKETLVTDTNGHHREMSPKTFIRRRKENVVVVNSITNLKSADVQASTKIDTESAVIEDELSVTSNKTDNTLLADYVPLEIDLSVATNLVPPSSITDPISLNVTVTTQIPLQIHSILQTPTNASELDHTVPQISEEPKTNDINVNETKTQNSESKHPFPKTDSSAAILKSLQTENVIIAQGITPKISIHDVALSNSIETRQTSNSTEFRPLQMSNKLKFTKSTNNLKSLLALIESHIDADASSHESADLSELDLFSNELKTAILSDKLEPSVVSNESSTLRLEESNSTISSKIGSNTSKESVNILLSDDLCKSEISSDATKLSEISKSSNHLSSTSVSDPNSSTSREETNKLPFLKPLVFRRPERRINRESERDRAIEVKSVTEVPLPKLCAESESTEQRPGFDGSLLGGVTDHYVPDLILQGTIAKPCKWETDLRRDLDITSYLNKQIDSPPIQAVAIIGDTNTWEVRVVGRECGGGGMSSLVAAMLDALPHMCRARVPAHQCLSFVESKLREFCVLSKTLADMLMSTDFCDIATLTKSLNIDVNDVPLLLAVATTHTPQVATRYGISYR